MSFFQALTHLCPKPLSPFFLFQTKLCTAADDDDDGPAVCGSTNRLFLQWLDTATSDYLLNAIETLFFLVYEAVHNLRSIYC